MSETTTASEKRAAEILDGGNSWNVGDLEVLEGKLSAEGKSDLADAIRKLRVKTTDSETANKIIGGALAAPPQEALELAKRLAGYKNFNLARNVLKRARENPDHSREDDPALYDEIHQKSALYTYKDPDLPREWQLDTAFDLLQAAFDFKTLEDQETLGLAGGIFKRKWEADQLRRNLERSLFYYLRGYTMGVRAEEVEAARAERKEPPPADLDAAVKQARADIFGFLRDNPTCALWAEKDKGYCGINAAFALDLLAREEEEEAARAGLPAHVAQERRENARLIRHEITRSVAPLVEANRNNWWVYATLGEAYFGLGPEDPANYDEALRWLVEEPKKAKLKVNEWEYESTARQLARLALLHYPPSITEGEFEQTRAGGVLKKFLGDDEKAVRSTFRGKFGLGLSGGGFRASLFHIGVLAKLAELDVLRHVEVLSCVSGGSIVGAHYYLEVRKLLQTKPDEEITREDYVEIVKRVQRDFLKGVQRNIRTRVLAEWSTNVKMIFSTGYTRTHRVGELYERELFSRVEDGEGVVEGPKWFPDRLAPLLKWRRDKRYLNRLKIYPLLAGGKRQTDFNPRNHNWRRMNKAPALVLNAATLNTGHTWQFTASFMGEPPAPLNTEIENNYRLRRMWYDDAPPQYRDVRLGHAVAASSCVPGLFEPLILNNLYPDDEGKPRDDGRPEKEKLISVQLIDGGACDNQGVASLLEQDCTVMLISDASGQMEAQDVPGGGPLGVLLRTNNVIQARVRESQYADISARRRSSQLRGLMFIHLRQDLPGGNLAWKNCPPGLRKSDFERGGGESDETDYKVSASVQRKLSAIRTDLDSFTDAEAYALMASAYRMTERQFEGERKCVEGFPPPAEPEDWEFLKVYPSMMPRPDEQKEAGGGAAAEATLPRPNEGGREHLERLLGVGSNVPFKIWKLSTPLIVLKYALAAALLVAVGWLFYTRWDQSVIPWRLYSGLTFRYVAVAVGMTILIAAVTFALKAVFGSETAKNIVRVARWRSTLKSIAVGLVGSTVGFIAARIHLHIFDKLFLRYGKLDKFPKS